MAEAHPAVLGWIGSTFEGVGAYFPTPKRSVFFSYVVAVSQWKSIDRARRRMEERWGQRFASFFQKSGVEVANLFERTRTPAMVDGYLSRVFDPEIRRLYRALIEDVGSTFLADVDSFVRKKAEPYDVVGPYEIPEFADWIQKTTAKKVTYVSDTTKEAIRSTIRKGIDEGRSIYDIMIQLKNAHAFSKARGFTIARTEVISASNAAVHFGVKRRYNVKGMTKRWLATGDRRTRPTHQKANGQEQKFDEPFQVGGSQLMFPGDGSLGAAAKEIIQCRCVALYDAGPLAPLPVKPPRVPRVPKVPTTILKPPKPLKPPKTPESMKPKPLKPSDPDYIEKVGQKWVDDVLNDVEMEKLHHAWAVAQEEAAELRIRFVHASSLTRNDLMALWRKSQDAANAARDKFLEYYYRRHLFAESQLDSKLVLHPDFNMTDDEWAALQKAHRHWERIVGNIKELRDQLLDVTTGETTDIVSLISVRKTEDGRAWASGKFGKGGTATIAVTGKTAPEVIVHELTHLTENSVPGLKKALTEFHRKRTAGQELERLRDVTGNKGYSPKEKTRKDNYLEPYFGKEYSWDGKHTPGELATMTMQWLYADPYKILRVDPELCKVLMGALRRAQAMSKP